MTDTITLIGIVATPPRHLITNAGLAITSFRLASTQRRFDRAQEKWVDGDTNWYTITAFRQLAYNASVSLVKGDRVIVDGRIRVRDWQAGERSGTNIDVEADALGHDLAWGTARWVRTLGTSTAGGDSHASEDSTDRHESSGDPSRDSRFPGAPGEPGEPSDAGDSAVDAGNAASWASAGDGAANPSVNGSAALRPARKPRVSAPGSFRDQEEIPIPF